jgi:hypothetical protein
MVTPATLVWPGFVLGDADGDGDGDVEKITGSDGVGDDVGDELADCVGFDGTEDVADEQPATATAAAASAI